MLYLYLGFDQTGFTQLNLAKTDLVECGHPAVDSYICELPHSKSHQLLWSTLRMLLSNFFV